MSSIVDLKDMERHLDSSENETKEPIAGYIYIMHVREFLNQNLNIYKIGRTKDIIQRFSSYPKGTIIKYCVFVHDIVLFEGELIKLFKDRFILRTDLGREYFEGDWFKMSQVVQGFISDHLPINNPIQTIQPSIPTVQLATIPVVKRTLIKIDASIAVMEYVDKNRSTLFTSEGVIVRSKDFYTDFQKWIETNNYDSTVSFMKMAAVLKTSYEVDQDVRDFDDGRNQVS